MVKKGYMGYGSPQALEAAITAEEDEHFEIAKESLLYIVVCSDLPKEEVIARMSRRISGTSGGWQFEDKPEHIGDCSEKPGFKHYLFEC